MGILVRRATDGEKKYMRRCECWESDRCTFDYDYDHNETCYIERGKARLEYNGNCVEFGEGDLVFFPKYLSCKWTVIEPIKKYLR